ncbi:basic phospholipase A2 PA-12C-like [Acropora muricata]|uniref:basic phospholipase A2 PA-12C-like n=1 Tax=Acropora muricata TaxID=159855 RepID=UPI0034E46C3E
MTHSSRTSSSNYCKMPPSSLKIVVLLAILPNCCFASGFQPENKSTSLKQAKRNLLQFGGMIHCATRRWALEYNGYGCWCGLGGSGTPVDDTDKCCRAHDNCYDDAIKKECNPYVTSYSRKGCTGCASTSKCGRIVCHCDAVAARCFAKAKFDPSKKGYRHGHSC